MKIMKPVVCCMGLFCMGHLNAKDCTSEADTFGRYQIINKGMLELTLAGKMNYDVSDFIGKQSKKAQALAQQGDYQEACDVYQAVIDKYGFKTFEETYYEQNPDKRPGAQKNVKQPEAKPASASSAVAAEEAVAGDSE